MILIPARYQSTRYPGKPLVELKGAAGAAKPLIQRSVEAARRVAGVSGVFVVTDDERIADACTGFGVGVIMTSPECRNGTERCAEALAQLHDPDLVINFQGDALLTPPGFVEALIARMDDDQRRPGRDPRVAAAGATEVRALQAEEAAGRVGGTSVVTDAQRLCALFLEAADPPFAGGRARSTRCRRCGCMSASMPIGPRRSSAMSRPRSASWKRSRASSNCASSSPAVPIAVVEVETPPFALRELNNPEDVAPIEQALAEAGLE